MDFVAEVSLAQIELKEFLKDYQAEATSLSQRMIYNWIKAGGPGAGWPLVKRTKAIAFSISDIVPEHASMVTAKRHKNELHIYHSTPDKFWKMCLWYHNDGYEGEQIVRGHYRAGRWVESYRRYLVVPARPLWEINEDHKRQMVDSLKTFFKNYADRIYKKTRTQSLFRSAIWD